MNTIIVEEKAVILNTIKNTINNHIDKHHFLHLKKNTGVKQSRYLQIMIEGIHSDIHYEIIFRKNILFIELHIENEYKSDFLKPKLSLDPNRYKWFQKRTVGPQKREGYIIPFHVTSLHSFKIEELSENKNIETIIQILKNFDIDFSEQLQSTLQNFPHKNTSMNKSIYKSDKQITHPLNQILYGPPGTGKTYNTINKTLEILTNDFYIKNKNNREALHNKFSELKKSGQIEFVTFHQNYGYEDFIEGLKAETDTNGNVQYETQSGIFKKICEKASIQEKRSRLEKFSFEKNNIFKMSLGGDKKSKIKEWCFENNKIALGWGGNIDFSSLTNISPKEKFKQFSTEKLNISSKDWTIPAMYKFIHDMKIGDLVLISDGNSTLSAIGEITGEYEFNEDLDIQYSQFRSVKWIIQNSSIPVSQIYKKKFSQQTIYTMSPADIIQNPLKELISTPHNTEQKPHIIIIDEINRGNISKIFGELITLIEPSKRMGNNEALEVTLPSSQEKFSIPNNLYILGTMNTADRSIALLDTALRRRFEFIEIMPQYEILPDNIEGINLQKLLASINTRIEYLYDRDHCLGHAYFMDIKNYEDMQHIFATKIIPLLQEYFYDDWEKINLILGNNSFIQENPLFSQSNIFTSNIPEHLQFEDEKKFYEVTNSETWTSEHFVKIYE